MHGMLERHIVILEQRGKEIDVLSQLYPRFTCVFIPGKVNKHGDVRRLVPRVAVVFVYHAMLTGHQAVVGGQNDEGIIPTVLPVDLVEERTEPSVGHR